MTRWLLMSILLTAAAWAAFAYVGLFATEMLIDPVPVHWNAHMEPDAFVPRDQAWMHLLLYPGVMSLMVGLTLLLPWLSPKHFEVGRDLFRYGMALVIMLFAYLGALHIVAITTEHGMPARAFVAGFFLFFALLGNIMGKVQRNFWMGVRTPWTLANETVWARTHRLAAWLWVGVGVLGFIAVFVGVPWLWCFMLLMAAALYPVLHSLIVYKRLERQGKIV
jgi:uncharacterized membrane protein